jgi:hypothetical protein
MISVDVEHQIINAFEDPGEGCYSPGQDCDRIHQGTFFQPYPFSGATLAIDRISILSFFLGLGTDG